MKLLNDFYKITAESKEGKGLNYTIELNKDHFIYKAHFPQNPITPGVCIIQICRELMEVFMRQELIIDKITNLKFLKTIIPTINKTINVSISKISIDESGYNASAVIYWETNQFSKLSFHLKNRPAVVGAYDENSNNSVNKVTKESTSFPEMMNKHRICVIIPTYNNAPFLEEVIQSVLQYTSSLIVVNDGSTDDTKNVLNRWKHLLEIISLEQNRGKGYALNRGFKRAKKMGFNYAITMDSDGQLKADDIPQFIDAVKVNPNAMIIGSRNLRQKNMPKKNTFANKFSNFWFAVQTGISLPDTQTGFRMYPLHLMGSMQAFSNRYEAELELLVRLAWRNVKMIPVPVQVYYPPERITHFRPFKDFFRISLLNSLFVFLAIIYGYPSRLLRPVAGKKEIS